MNQAWQLIGRIVYWLTWPATSLYIRGSQRTRVLLVVDKEVLLVKGWLGNGNWSLPGGGLHGQEVPSHGAVRELREETGVNLEPHVLTFVETRDRRSHGVSFKMHIFTAELDQKPVIKTQRFEIATYSWQPIVSVLQDSATKPYIKEVLHGYL